MKNLSNPPLLNGVYITVRRAPFFYYSSGAGSVLGGVVSTFTATTPVISTLPTPLDFTSHWPKPRLVQS
jgi:hypothetical protein